MSKANYLIIHLTSWAGVAIGAKHYYCEIDAFRQGECISEDENTAEKTEWKSFDRMIGYLNLALLDRYPKHLPRQIEFHSQGFISKTDFLKQYRKFKKESSND